MHDTLSPHVLCTYLYELCQCYNSFYNDCQVIDHPRSAIRVNLVQHFANTLKTGLNLLGIQEVDSI